MYIQGADDVLKPTSTHVPLPTIVPSLPEFQAAGESGHRTLWALFFIMTVSSLTIYVMAWRVPPSKRLLHILTGLATTIAAISYYAMAVGDGITTRGDVVRDPKVDPLPDLDKGIIREIYWARYVGWAGASSLLLLDLALVAGLNGAKILVAVSANSVLVLTHLFGALNDSHQSRDAPRWGYFTIGVLAYLVVIYQVVVGGRATVATKDSKTATFFASLVSYVFVLRTIYPIIWGLSEGSYTLGVDQEILAYGILDVLSTPVFAFWLLFTHDAMAASTFSVEGFWSHGLPTEGVIRVGDEDGA